MTGKARRFRRDRSDSTETGAAEPVVDEATAEPHADDARGAAENTADRSTAEADGSTDTSDAPPEATPEPSDATAADPEPGGTDAEVDPAEVDPAEGTSTTAPRPRAPRRGTPAASAASRARRIGGVRTGTGAGPGAAAATVESDDEAATATTGRVSTAKSTGRPAPRKAGASARITDRVGQGPQGRGPRHPGRRRHRDHPGAALAALGPGRRADGLRHRHGDRARGLEPRRVVVQALRADQPRSGAGGGQAVHGR